MATVPPRSSVAPLNNGDDIVKTLQQPGSSDSLRNIALSMASVGALSELNTSLGLDKINHKEASSHQKLGDLTLPHMRLDRFSTVVFAGGGNRCWWQAGLASRLTEQGVALPRQLIGTSAGAAIAAAYMVNGIPEALRTCIELYRNNETLIRWDKLRRLQVEFAHRQIYPAWIQSFITQTSFEVAKASKYALTAAVTHPIRFLGTTISVSLATLAYLIDKKLWHNIHPQLPKYMGLRQGFYPLHECSALKDAHELLCAAAAAPPVMHPVKIKGLSTFDGGYTDNAPIVPQTKTERLATLVLLTRHYPAHQRVFQYQDRTYLQPSRPVPVSTWDCTPKATVSDAYALGYEDANTLLGSRNNLRVISGAA